MKILSFFLALFVGSIGLSAPAFAADYDDALSFAWDGGTYSSDYTQSFISNRAIAPGSTDARTLAIRNDGPTKGKLSIYVINVATADPLALDTSGENFYDDLQLTWSLDGVDKSTSFSDAAQAGKLKIGEVPLGKADSTSLTMGYLFPDEAISGNKANVDPRLASFDVQFVIEGNLPPKDDDNNGGGGDGDTILPKTGGPAFWLLILGGGLLGAGGALIAKARRSS